MEAMNRGTLCLGAGMTLLGLVALLAKGSSGSPAMVFVLALLTVWLLAPYAALFLLQWMAAPTRANQSVLAVASVLLAALAVLGYVPMLMSSRPRPCASAMTLMVIPVYQWVPTVVASVACALLPGRARR